MGRLIEADELKAIVEYCILANVPADAENTKEDKWNDWIQTVIDKQPTVEAIPKDQYEARLRADLVAILEDLDLQIDESAAYNLEVAKVQKLIRDRIGKLKEDKE